MKQKTVHDLARPAQQGWLSHENGYSQYNPQRQMQMKRRPLDRPRKGRRAHRG